MDWQEIGREARRSKAGEERGEARVTASMVVCRLTRII